jgi:hypothetical protein
MASVITPLRHPGGSLHQFTLKDMGNPFRCECGCNVFHKPDDTDLDLYECNGCGDWYRSCDASPREEN